MITFRFPLDPAEPSSPALPGRLWLWLPEQLAPDRVDASVDYYVRQLHGRTDETPLPPDPAALYLPVLDTEEIPHADREATILRTLRAFNARNIFSVPIIQWYAGMMSPYWSLERQLAALEGGKSPDRDTMFATAKRHRQIVRMAGLATYYTPVESAQRWHGAGEWGNRRWMIEQAQFARAAFGVTVRVGAWISSCPADVLDDFVAVLNRHYDFAFVYGPGNEALCDALARASS